MEWNSNIGMEIIRIIQIVGIFIPLVGVVTLLKKEFTEASANLTLANISCLFINGCYLLVLQSTGLDAAMQAMKLSYLGNVIFYFFFIRFVASYLKIRLPQFIFNVWALIEMIGVFTMWNDNYNKMFYADTDWMEQEKMGFHYIQTDNGILMTIRYGVLSVWLGYIVIYTISRLFRTALQTERNNLARVVGAQLIIMAAFSFTAIFKPPFDIVPISSSIAIFIIIQSVIKGELFNITDRGRDVLFEHIREVFIIVDSAFGYVDSNAYAKELFPELKHKAKNTSISKELHYYFKEAEEEFCIGDRYFRKKVASLDQGGKVYGYTLILTDETRDHQYIEELQIAKTKAEEASEARANFMSNMSHEIRTPMNAIVGMTEILLREDMPKQQKEYMENIKNSGNALLGIVNDILDFSKIESGKMDIVEEDYMPRTMFSDLRMILLNRIGDKDIDLIFDIDDRIPNRLYGDSLRLRQVILNLANNATKFTQEGYVKLSAQVQKIEGSDIELYFSVKDTGQGIHKEDLEKLFHSFQRVDTKKNRNVEGTGLGLAISKQLVELMDGDIGVRSEYGKGSEFYFTVHQTIPTNQEDIVSEPMETLNFIAPDADILIVDDNEMNRKVAKGLLEPLQMKMDFAEDGAKALQMIEKKRYHLVFMDHMMPVMDGIEATKRLRRVEDAYYKQLPVVALSANAIKEVRESFFQAGMNDFVAKPIDMKDICKVIRKWLPSELIIETQVQMNNAVDADDLPAIEGLDVQEGVKNSGSKELFLSLLGDFYKLIDMKSTKIEKCLADGMIRDYTIEVHALKNTARMIGAMELSEMFYQMEMLGNAEEVEALVQRTPEVLEKYRSYKPILKPFAEGQEQDKKEASKAELIEILQKLRYAMDGFDLDTVDEAMKQLEECQIPSACQEKIELLRAYVADVAMEEVMSTTDEMIQLLTEE